MEITPELLRKYMQGRCTREEAKAVESWYRSPNESIDGDTDVSINMSLEDKIWENIDKATRGEGATEKHGPWKKFRIMGIAATLLIFIGVGTLVFLDAQISFRTKAGQTETVILEDGTKVHLNAVSSLIVSKEFNEGKREVFLEGEAFFEVARDEKRPFKVTTSSSSTVVLGTQFNLKAYMEGEELLTLKEGSVSYSFKNSAGEDQIVLTPNEQVVLNKGEIRKKSVNVNDYLGWMSNTLIFNNEPLSEIAKTLERRFDVKIRIDDKGLGPEPFKGKFEDPFLDMVLEDLGFVMKFNYRREDNTIIIY